MAFPDDDLDATIEVAFGADLTAAPGTWTFTDLTADWRTVGDLTVVVGGADGASRAQPIRIAFQLTNLDGRYTKGNPLSPHYPHVVKNTPCRVTIDPGTGSTEVYEALISSWVPRFPGNSGQAAYVDVVAYGVMHRFELGKSLVRSPLYRRTILGAKHYWPAEDGTTSTQIAEVTGTGRAMGFTGAVTFRQGTPPPGSQPVLKLGSGATVSGTISFASTNSWSLAYLLNLPASVAGDTVVAQWYTTGTFKTMRHVLTQNYSGGKDYLRLQGFDSTGAMTLDDPIPYDVGTEIIQAYGHWVYVTVAFGQSGGSIDYQHAIDSGETDDGTFGSGTLTTTTGGVPADLLFTGAGAMVDAGLGQISVWDRSIYTAADIDLIRPLLSGQDGELVTDRLTRVCDEQGVSLVIVGTSEITMGPQPAATFAVIVRECEDADGGRLLDGFGLRYLCRSAAYNLTPSMTLDMSARQVTGPFEPADDDQYFRNTWKVSRTNGSSASATDATDPVEEYEDSVTLNLESDDTLRAQATWRLNLSTAEADQLRHPRLVFKLHELANTGLIEPWIATDIRSRLALTHPPADQFSPDALDLLLVGYSETIRKRRTWTIVANCAPYRPWEVFKVGNTRLGRVQAVGFTLHQGYSSSATSLLVDSATSRLWTTTALRPADFPHDIEVAGERMTVTAVTGSSSPQTFTVTRHVNGVVKAQSSGATVKVWRPGVIAL